MSGIERAKVIQLVERLIKIVIQLQDRRSQEHEFLGNRVGFPPWFQGSASALRTPFLEAQTREPTGRGQARRTVVKRRAEALELRVRLKPIRRRSFIIPTAVVFVAFCIGITYGKKI